MALAKRLAMVIPSPGLTGRQKRKNMKIKELLNSVVSLVESREIIDHGSIRCLHSDNAVSEIQAAEGCDEVGTGTVGDDDLAAELRDLADNGDRMAELDLKDINRLHEAFRGNDIGDYLQSEKEDELVWLDQLIDAARELV